ncbi:MAG TPA: hypothetical protein VNV43_08425, partial [Candidatus Acidoferrales bacterium]|nr:hypothetical protein [Candidatus Acidoferrales bacterium]
ALPLYVPETDENDFRAEIELPAGYHETGIAPKNKKIVAPGGSEARVTERDDGSKCVVTEQFETKPGIIKPKEYSDLLNIQSALGQKSATTFLLEQE